MDLILGGRAKSKPTTIVYGDTLDGTVAKSTPEMELGKGNKAAHRRGKAQKKAAKVAKEQSDVAAVGATIAARGAVFAALRATVHPWGSLLGLPMRECVNWCGGVAKATRQGGARIGKQHIWGPGEVWSWCAIWRRFPGASRWTSVVVDCKCGQMSDQLVGETVTHAI